MTLATTGVLTREHFRRTIDWPLLIFLGVILGMPTMIHHIGVDAQLATALPPLVVWAHGSPAWTLTLLFAIVTAARFLLSEWVAIPLLTATLAPLRADARASPLGHRVRGAVRGEPLERALPVRVVPRVLERIGRLSLRARAGPRRSASCTCCCRCAGSWSRFRSGGCSAFSGSGRRRGLRPPRARRAVTSPPGDRGSRAPP